MDRKRRAGAEHPFRFLFIGSRETSGEGRFAAALEGALRGGADAFLLREKRMAGGPLLRLALASAPAVRAAGALFLLSDRIDVAIAAGADGVQLPENGFTPGEARSLVGPDRLIGRSVHDEAGAREAERAGADFLLVGPVFPTPGKERFALGPERAAAIRRAVRIPAAAVGGIDPQCAGRVRAAGFEAIAVIRAVASAADPERAAAETLRAFVEGRA
ncbi:MAG: thiamine phosphate synthase [Candidatus Eisenbacteria bacterium]|nr:thiamine phosphate synthase [Candidatus Eisenbacteria bacterium]